MPEQSSLYAAIGGEDGIARLVASYVRILRDNPSFGQLRALYTPEGIKRYDSRMREFLSGWLGGPALYQERHGLPMLRESHRAIPIDRALMQEWMRVMQPCGFVWKEPLRGCRKASSTSAESKPFRNALNAKTRFFSMKKRVFVYWGSVRSSAGFRA